MKANIRFGEIRYSNVEIIAPEDDSTEGRYTLKQINDSIFGNIVLKNKEKFIEE